MGVGVGVGVCVCVAGSICWCERVWCKQMVRYTCDVTQSTRVVKTNPCHVCNLSVYTCMYISMVVALSHSG